MATKTKSKAKYRLSIVWIEVPAEVDRMEFEATDPVPVAKMILKGQDFPFNEDYVALIKKYNRTTKRYRTVGELRGTEDFKIFHPTGRR